MSPSGVIAAGSAISWQKTDGEYVSLGAKNQNTTIPQGELAPGDAAAPPPARNTMSGRSVLAPTPPPFQSRFNTDELAPEIDPSFNVAPTQWMRVVISRGGKNRLELMQWGLVPP